MGKGYLGLDLTYIDLQDRGVGGVGIGIIKSKFPFRPVLDVIPGDLIGDEDAVFGPRLNYHIRNGEAVGHGQITHRFSGELHRPVGGAIHADLPDHMEDQIFPGHPGVALTAKNDLHRLRDFKPQLACQHDRGQVGAAHPRCEGSQGAVGAGVAVGADHKVSGDDNSLLGQKDMAHPDLSTFVVMAQLMLPGKIPENLAVLGGRDILVRREVIGNDHHPVAVKDLVPPGFLEFRDGDGGRDIVPHGNIDLRVDQHPGLNLFESRMLRQNLFRNRHAHAVCPSLFFISFYSYAITLFNSMQKSSRHLWRSCPESLLSHIFEMSFSVKCDSLHNPVNRCPFPVDSIMFFRMTAWTGSRRFMEKMSFQSFAFSIG